MKLAAVRFTEYITVPRLSSSQSYKADAKRGVALEFAPAPRIVYIRLRERNGKQITYGVPLERVLWLEPFQENEKPVEVDG